MVIVEGVEPYDRALEQPLLQEVEGVADDFGPWAGWEFDFAKDHPLAYPITRTLADIIPFASKFFPSGRREFSEMSALGKTLDVGLDLAVLIPMGMIGKGIKWAAGPVIRPLKPVGQAAKNALPFRIRKVGDYAPAYLDEMAGKMDKFVYRTPRQRAAAEWGLADDEAAALVRGEQTVWTSSGARSDFFVEETRGSLKGLFKKDGTVRKPVQKKLDEWGKSPVMQRFEHQVAQYKQKLRPHIKDEADIDFVFKSQVHRLFPEDASKLTLENIGGRDFSKVLMDLLMNRGRIVKYDIGSRHYLMPVRKVLGQFGDAYRKIYQPVVKHFGAGQKAAMLHVEMFHKLLWQKGLLRLGPKKKAAVKWSTETYERGKWKELYTMGELKEAGRGWTHIDNMRGGGATQEAINIYSEGLSYNARNLIKAADVWTDRMYADLMKDKIPQLFRRAGLTDQGQAAVGAVMEKTGKGLNASISVMFSDGANTAYNVKAGYVARQLHDLRKIIEKSPRWFQEPEGDAVKQLLRDLTPRKPQAKVGFPNYIQNYSPRLFSVGRTEKAAKAATVPGEMTAGFVKARTMDVAEGRVEDLMEIVAARARQQGREIFVYPHLPGLRAASKELPPRLQTYVGHYFSRMLGMSSPVDERIAATINRAMGSEVAWDARRVQNLAWKINDLIYMGGIGFKPFSAMRNLVQVPLNVPADMGGIKDVYHLIRGIPKAMNPKTYPYLKEIGAITEYSPDILFRPTMSKLRKHVGVLALPRKQELRDLGMYMFKKSDQWNRLWTGSAAMVKWETMFAKHMVGKKNLKAFKKKLNLGSREKWVRKDIDDLLDSGNAAAYEEAKKLWIKDVVADTQYLYGAADSPIIGQIGGGVTKTAAVFQSWWMNYAELLGKWAFRSESVPKATQRYFMWMISSGAIMYSMENIWGKPRARATAFLGPIPSQMDAPASWRPFIEGLNAMRMAAEITVGRDPEDAKKQMIAALKTAMVYMPAGIQLKQMWAGYQKDKWSGVFKESLGYRPPEK